MRLAAVLGEVDGARCAVGKFGRVQEGEVGRLQLTWHADEVAILQLFREVDGLVRCTFLHRHRGKSIAYFDHLD